jgi:hypothetical protein
MLFLAFPGRFEIQSLPRHIFHHFEDSFLFLQESHGSYPGEPKILRCSPDTVHEVDSLSTFVNCHGRYLEKPCPTGW